jgi:ADP-heptose:LPS heptosyltransferase
MKIALLQLKRIGDLLLTLPVTRAIRREIPDAKLTLMILDCCEELIPLFTEVDEILVYRRCGANGKIWRRLIFSGFDACLDFTGNDRSGLFSFLSKARARVAYASVQRSAFRAMFFNRFVDSAVREHHTVAHHGHLLKGIGLSGEAEMPRIEIPEWARQKAARVIEKEGVAGEYFAIHPGTARTEKEWLPERWAEVVDACRKRTGWRCVVTGGTDGGERAHAARVADACGATDLSGKLDLISLGGLYAKASLVMTVDTAPMHLAGALGVPQVALFGPTNPFHWRPIHGRVAVVDAGNEEPVTAFDPRRRGRPMSELSTGSVIRAMEKVLRGISRQ